MAYPDNVIPVHLVDPPGTAFTRFTFQYDTGMVLLPLGVELPHTYQVDFANDETCGTSITQIGDENGVSIPSQFFNNGANVWAFIWLTDGNSGYTRYRVCVSLIGRPSRTNEQPTPEQQSAIDQAISALNDAVEQTGADVIAADASADRAEQAAASAEAAAGSATDSETKALVSEGFAVGEQDGTPVTSGSPYYHNNASYYADQASGSATTASNKAGEASDSAGTASQKATAAGNSADAAAADALKAEGYAVGRQNGSDVASGSPYYHANAKYYKDEAGSSATAASGSADTAGQKALVAEGYAAGTQNGSAVASGSPYYHNNASYYKDQAADSATAAAASAQSVSESAAQIETNKEDISDLQSALTTDGGIESYLYKANYYLASNGTETPYSGINIYKIPVSAGDLITISTKSGTSYWGALTANVVHQYMLADSSLVGIPAAVGNANGYFDTTNKKQVSIAPATSTNLYVNVLATESKNVILRINNNGSALYNRLSILRTNVKAKASELTGFASEYYKRTDGTFRKLGGYNVYPIYVKQKDVVLFEDLPGTLTFFGTFYNLSDGTTTAINNVFEATNNGIVFAFADYYVIPYDCIPSADVQYKDCQGVAFGTSITYRAQTTYGYLQYLPQLSGIDFDNQGIGGSGIMTGTLTAIQNYTDYSNKRVVIIEGFVNDWYLSQPLGSYTDAGTETACGCLRTAINYIMAQNPNIQVFVVLDHYGKSATGGTCASTAQNGNNLTQYQYYEEMAKVCESLGIPAIKLYTTSGISENTPQYLTDNIHPTKLGARQTAYCIWYQMKQYPINQIA